MHTYSVFIDTVAQGRNLPRKAVETMAEGKIYSGAQAKEIRLVDELGGFTDAVGYAAAKADIEDNYSVKVLYKTPPVADEIIKALLKDNAQFYTASDLQLLHELLRLHSKKGFYVYNPIRILPEE